MKDWLLMVKMAFGMADCYILDADKHAVRTTIEEWAKWFEDIEHRRVAEEYIGPYRVSTVFLGLDHSFGGPRPLMFETKTFDEQGEELDCDRCTTWEEAIDMHKRAVEHAKNRGKRGNDQRPGTS
jgi:hypothetical protein